MPWYNLVSVSIDLTKLKNNFLLLKQKHGFLWPVIKADAYGHGLLAVAKALIEAGASGFCVGSVEEAVVLRLLPFDGQILSLLGPVSSKDCALLVEHKILPVIHNFEQLRLLKQTLKRPFTIALKFDTGMARLGFDLEDIDRIQTTLQDSNLKPVLLLSHLATADVAEDKFVLEQLEVFRLITSRFQRAGFRLKASLANSAGILGWPETYFDLARPGIALYGANPFAQSKWEKKGAGLTEAMQVTAPIISVHDLKKGQTISYGRTFTAPKNLRVAIIAIGYADNYSRLCSNQGKIIVNGKKCPVLGRVCMQMLAIDVTGLEVRTGAQAFVLGGNEPKISVHELAKWWQTIPYEVFCLLGQNKRRYIN